MMTLKEAKRILAEDIPHGDAHTECVALSRIITVLEKEKVSFASVLRRGEENAMELAKEFPDNKLYHQGRSAAYMEAAQLCESLISVSTEPEEGKTEAPSEPDKIIIVNGMRMMIGAHQVLSFEDIIKMAGASEHATMTYSDHVQGRTLYKGQSIKPKEGGVFTAIVTDNA